MVHFVGGCWRISQSGTDFLVQIIHFTPSFIKMLLYEEINLTIEEI